MTYKFKLKKKKYNNSCIKNYNITIVQYIIIVFKSKINRYGTYFSKL